MKEAVPSITILFHSASALTGWPLACPKDSALSIDGRFYTFRHKNNHSGETFELVLESRFDADDEVPGEEEIVSWIRLKFKR